MKCNRCGKCCQHLTLHYSSRKLKEEYLKWFNQKGGTYVQEIYLIYPMLKYICYDKKIKSYIYKCMHFKKLLNRKGLCKIYNIKPKMCENFPFYHKKIGNNFSIYKTCGYNIDKNIGIIK